MAGMTSEIVKAYMDAPIDGFVRIENAAGPFVLAFTLNYKFQGQDISNRNGDVTIGMYKSSPIPSGAIDIVLTVIDFWGFGWSTIFTKNWKGPIRFAAKIWSTALGSRWEEVPA